ncbi:MAG: hypothetical protein R3B72_51950 [Polyangiaceae bacterium]
MSSCAGCGSTSRPRRRGGADPRPRAALPAGGDRGRVAPQSVDVAAAVEARVRALLADFLHPTRGGPRGDGWRFGESLLASWIAMRLERLDGVDHATDLRLVVSRSIVEERVDVAADEIVAAGEQLVIMTLGAV